MKSRASHFPMAAALRDAALAVEKLLATAEDSYRDLLEAAPDAMVVVNRDGDIVLLNLQAEKQFGYRRDELLGQRVTNIIPEGFAERLIADDLRSAEDALAQQIGTGIELTARRKDGSTFPIEIMLSPLESAEGILVTAAIRDISVREAAERHLVQMEGRYRGLLEAAPDAMVVVNRDGDIVLLNLQAEKQFGYHRDELLGQRVTNIIPEGFAERLIADDLRSDEDALAQQIGTGIELTARRKDGSTFPIEIMLSPLESAEGVLVTAAIRDTSARNLVEEERKRLARLKDEFVATVSHELRTPLTSIAGSLSLLMTKIAGDLPDPAPRLINIAHTNCQRLVRLVDDILDIGKMDAPQVAYRFARVEVQTLIQQAIEASRGYAEGYQVRIRLADGSPVDDVRADKDRLTQVITNLLSNAIKFSPAGDEVVVTIEDRSDVVRISVLNHGVGIPADFKPHMFGRFAQANATSTRHRGGSGLGLSIVKQIVDRLGGEVGFSDAPGETIFHVDIPCWDQLLGVAIDTAAPPDASRILLCEDDPDMAIVLREQLRQFGFATDFAYTAADALTLATATQYCVVLTDLQLPDCDGIDLIVRLRALPEYAETPLIVVSANPNSGRNDARSSELNVFHWLSKPVDFDHLMNVLPKPSSIVRRLSA